jgi:ABC-type nitrate/sulfonate/bicarbonate transport system substrate-binding protein
MRRVAFALCAVLFASLVWSNPVWSQGPELTNLEIWTSRDTQQGGLPLVAAKKGFFVKNGLNVTVHFVSSGSEIPSGMIGGSIPIAVASWVNPMQMTANGFPTKILV